MGPEREGKGVSEEEECAGWEGGVVAGITVGHRIDRNSPLSVSRLVFSRHGNIILARDGRHVLAMGSPLRN